MIRVAFLFLIALIPPASSEHVTYSTASLHYVTCGDDMVMFVANASDQTKHCGHVPDYRRQLHPSRRLAQQASSGLSFRRSLFWDLWPMLDTYKTQPSIWEGVGEARPTLASLHYIVVPVWWQDEAQNLATRMSRSQMRGVLDQVETYYDTQSWNKHALTFELWEQQVLPSVTADDADFSNSKEATQKMVEASGLLQGQDYDGIMLVYNVANVGPFSGAGGWGGVNDLFAWMSYQLREDVTRHELGHNYGHPHHLSNGYAWRLNDRGAEGTVGYDGWDMMSGGNAYTKSDFAAASKWFFNWMDDDAVVMMQPEGATEACPTCLGSIEGLVIRPFDDITVPPSALNKMAVHIPILATPANSLYSYWLSYRGSGNDGLAAGGLSVHLSWFNLGGPFGATYDSINYDAFGDTETTFDSFVLPGTCYVLAPSVLLMDMDYGAAEAVQPIACVEDISEGESITVSVSFLDPSAPPLPTVVLDSERTLSCSIQGSVFNTTVAAMHNEQHMLHYVGTGIGGMIDLTLCLEADTTSSVTAYFYDTYPNAYMALDSPLSYGAYKSLQVRSSACCGNDCEAGSSAGVSLAYTSEYGETYVLIISETEEVNWTLHVSSQCVLEQCHGNQFMGIEGECQTCPAGSVSQPGATSIDECLACGDDINPSHPKTPECDLDSTTIDPSIDTATGWRLWAPSIWTRSKWVWDVDMIEFYSSENCAADSMIDTSSGIAIDSGNAGFSWSSSNAFNFGRTWGGRPDDLDQFWIGMTFGSPVTVRCITLVQTSAHFSTALRVQANQNDSAVWRSVWEVSDLVDGENVIAFGLVSSSQPSSESSSSPTRAPSTHPSLDPTGDCALLWRRCERDEDCCSDSCRWGRCRLF